MPRSCARLRRVLESSVRERSHSTLPGIWCSRRSQTSNTGGMIFQSRLKQQKTKPVSGKPAWVRVSGAAEAFPVSSGKKQSGREDFFTVEGLVFRRRHHGISQDVIDEIGAR